jgi:hypothetical protein
MPLSLTRHDVLEDEHQAADVLDQLGIIRSSSALEDRLLGRAPGQVEDVGHRGNTPDALKALGHEAGEAFLEAALDLLDDVGAGLVHVGNARDDLDLAIGREPVRISADMVGGTCESTSAMVWGCSSLRKVSRFSLLGLLQEDKRLLVDLVLDGRDDAAGLVGGQRFWQQGPGPGQAAGVDVLPRQDQVVELVDDLLPQ